MLDELDRRILRHLQPDPARSMADLAEAARTTPAVCSRRLARLRARGVLRGQAAVIDWHALGYEVHVSLRVTLDKTQSNAFDIFLREAKTVPEVLEIQTFLGVVDVRLVVIARDMAHYQHLYRARILTLPHIADIEALVHVAEIKSGEVLPL
ncbi:Lrp/AsnC family transcriptional regulator [Tropicimonas sp. IMCC6043]|uniref:Lrp/AsnC family transcriptional regulator n=1 Tax=Tropicimonas sp. IMCC6043 TaxID=2510645 RepID=UPI00101B850C|nr:Lrp/AsnC family transcriptional regulator [Tropicimonas sp. IMCC6043]RYH08127.1 Lrp/AsnC family transcriptional regulator [Tropicimonas sp. IMCC6043]